MREWGHMVLLPETGPEKTIFSVTGIMFVALNAHSMFVTFMPHAGVI